MAKGHPLDALTADEIREAAAVCKAYAALNAVEPIRFNVIALKEPSKAEIIAYDRLIDHGTLSPPAPLRAAFCILQTPKLAGVIEVVVALKGLSPEEAGASQVESWKEVEGVQALATPDDCVEAEAIARSDPEVQRLLKERYGITDLSNVLCDPWSVHASPVAARIIQCFMYTRLKPEGNQYAHPLDMTPIVDMDKGKVVRIDLPYKEAPVEWNKKENDYHSDLQTKFTADPPKPLNITQPEGPSFTVEGNLIKWQKWEFRLGFTYREGIVLHQLGWRGGDDGSSSGPDQKLRPILHRLSLVEMAVPYADPNEPYTRKCAFDVGDYGLGYCTLPLELGCDCLGHIRYFDATFPNSKGEPVTISKAVCMHEEDSGLLYKHVDYRTGHSESRRMRKLVIQHVATVVNYEYSIGVHLFQDGTITMEIKLTGELSTNKLSPGEGPKPVCGTLVGPGVNAQHHQHMFCARIDPAIDDVLGGRDVVVCEVEAQAMPMDDANPYGNGFKAVETDLLTVGSAQRVINPSAGRIWKFKNPSVINPVTLSPVAYKLMPMAHPPLMAHPDSIITKKGHFATKQLWVTPHNDEQIFPAGDYVFGAKDCKGLKVWTAGNAAAKELAGSDPVVWYSFGLTHIVRPEDFPIMPCEVCSFTLKPAGFFTMNPCLDLPKVKNAASKEDTAASCCGTNGANGNGAAH